MGDCAGTLCGVEMVEHAERVVSGHSQETLHFSVGEQVECHAFDRGVVQAAEKVGDTVLEEPAGG